MQSTARGLLSGAFWGLLVGGVVLVLAALALDARRTARLEAERLAARPVAPVAWSQGQQSGFGEALPPQTAGDPAPRGIEPKADVVQSTGQAAPDVAYATVPALDQRALPSLPVAPEPTSIAVGMLAAGAAEQPSVATIGMQPSGLGAVKRAPLPSVATPSGAQLNAPNIAPRVGSLSIGASAPQQDRLAIFDVLAEPAREIATPSLGTFGTAAKRAKLPDQPNVSAGARAIPRVDPAPSSQNFDAAFLALPDVGVLGRAAADTGSSGVVTPPVRFGRLIWTPPLGRSAAQELQTPSFVSGDLRGPTDVVLSLSIPPPEGIGNLRLAASDNATIDWAPVLSPAVVQPVSAAVSPVAALEAPVPARLSASGSPQAERLPRIALIVAGDVSTDGALPDWAGGAGILAGPGSAEAMARQGAREVAIWLQPGGALPDLGARDEDPRTLLYGPGAPASQVEAAQRSGWQQAPVYRHLDTPDGAATAALAAAAARATRDGQVVVTVENDAAVFEVVDQWLKDNASFVRPVTLDTILR